MLYGMSIMRLSLMLIALGAVVMFALPSGTAYAHGAHGYTKALTPSYAGSQSDQGLRPLHLGSANARHAVSRVSAACSDLQNAGDCDGPSDHHDSENCGSDCQPVMNHLHASALACDNCVAVSARERAILISRSAVDVKPPRA